MTIRKIGSQFRVVSSKGENLGTFKTEKEAEKREKQINFFKHLAKKKK